MRRILPLLILTSFFLMAETFRLDSITGLELLNVKGEAAMWRGRRAVRLIDQAEASKPGEAIAIVTGANFKDGTIEIEVAGNPRAGAGQGARGFIGIAFRVQPHGSRFECFYLRPTNGRADDQLRRNHSTQYISAPDFPWERLRKEFPGVYESYVDLEPGVWTKMKVVVSGSHAQLFVHDAAQPALIVNDLKLGDSSGGVALWVGSDTDGYFSNLTIK